MYQGSRHRKEESKTTKAMIMSYEHFPQMDGRSFSDAVRVRGPRTGFTKRNGIVQVADMYIDSDMSWVESLENRSSFIFSIKLALTLECRK